MSYPDLKNDDPTLLKRTIIDEHIEEKKCKTGKHDHEKFLKSRKIDKNFYNKKHSKKKEKEKKHHSPRNPNKWYCISCSYSLSIAGVKSVATLITNEYFSILNLGYAELKVWRKMITLLYEKTLNNSMIDKKIDEKEGEILK